MRSLVMPHVPSDKTSQAFSKYLQLIKQTLLHYGFQSHTIKTQEGEFKGTGRILHQYNTKLCTISMHTASIDTIPHGTFGEV